MTTSPTQRSLALMRERGWIVEKVEHWNAYAKMRKDLFNVLDLVALRDGELAGVQTTSGDNMAARRTKILDEPKARAWIKAGGTIHLHGWRLAGARGKRKTWAVREEQITLGDFDSCDALRAVCEAKETA